MDEQKNQEIWEQWEKAVNQMTGYVLAELTDNYVVDVWPSEHMRELLETQKWKVLEIRVFNSEKEMKLFRGDIGSTFRLRTLDESGKDTEDYYDEEQYLDIDTRRSAELFQRSQDVYTTGGGQYHLPLNRMNEARIMIRYHIGKYEDSGQARIEDWRVVDFKEG